MSNLQRIAADMPDIVATWLFLREREGEWFTKLPPVNRNWTLKLGLLTRWRVQRLLARGSHFDAIICNSLPLLTFMQGIRRRIPTVLWVDCTPEMLIGSGPWYRKPSASRKTVRRRVHDALHTDRVYSDAALIVSWSEATKRSLLQDYGLDEKKVLCIPPGIFPLEWPGQNRSSGVGKLNGTRAQVLFVGGEFARKGGELLLETAKRPEFRKTDFQVVTRADVRDVPENVFVHGGIQANSPELHALYSSADIFVLPTYADFAPTNAVCEAMATGIPVVTTLVGGLAEVVRDGENGYIIKPGDSDALADRVNRLLNSPEDRHRMGAAGQRIVRERFDLRRNFRKFLDAVETAIAQNRYAS